MAEEKKEETKSPELNFTEKEVKKKKKIPVILKIIIGIFIFCIILAAFLSYKVASVGKNVLQPEENDSIITQIKHLILAENKKLNGEKEGRTNILLLGMGGEGHQGALLTDTIMVASIKYNKNDNPEVALISIPRDLAVPFENSNYVRINSIYAYGEMNEEGSGGKIISEYINRITNLPIHYYVRVDFEGFKQAVDSLNGIEVEVKNSFYDSQYPTENFGYQTISFEKGLIQMDGDLALKYARSRHGIVTDGTENEGSDFSRAKRQQQILTAVKNKAFSLSTIANPKKINELLDSLGNHTRTDLELWEILKLTDIAKNIDNNKIINKVIDQESGLLIPTTGRNNAYLLSPPNNDFSNIKALCQNIFDPEKIEEIKKEKEEVNVAILNGTLISGLARINANRLNKENFDILYTGNAKEQDYEKTVIYDLSYGEKPNALKELIEKYNANTSSNNFYSENVSKNPIKNINQIDFVVILGLNSDI